VIWLYALTLSLKGEGINEKGNIYYFGFRNDAVKQRLEIDSDEMNMLKDPIDGSNVY
jgi:hypothetical protein